MPSLKLSNLFRSTLKQRAAATARRIEAFKPQAVPEPPAALSLVAMIDLPSASLNELRTIHDMAEHFGAAAYAWESRCRPRTDRQGGPEFNQAGKLMSWLGDALAAVETEIRKETQRRVPDNALDQETRLAMLAVQTIENGSPDEVEAFARELLEIAEADRATEALAAALRARAQAEPESC